MSEPLTDTPDQPDPQNWPRASMSAYLVAVLDHRRLSRGMQFAKWTTRVVNQGAVHEIVSVPSTTERSDETVNDCSYVGFACFDAGLLGVGDEFRTSDGRLLGTLIGFDETHEPNHLNLLITSADRRPGTQLGLEPGQQLNITRSNSTKDKSVSFACVKCGEEYGAGLHLNCKSCGGVIDPIYDVNTVVIDETAMTSARKYFDLLPIRSTKSLIDMGEGQTPLLHAVQLGRRVGMSSLYLKDETLNPTRTTKDRMAATTLSMFSELGIPEFVASSTGNSSTSFSYGVTTACDLKIHLFAGRDFLGRHGHSDHPNVQLHAVDGDFVAAQAAARKFADKNNLVFEGGFFNVARREGLKLAYLEAFDQMEQKPEVVVQAISSGMGIYGAWRGAQQFVALGRMPKLPRFVCVQQSSCSPMVHAFEEGAETIDKSHIIEQPHGIAKAILRGDPTNTYPYMREIVLSSNGSFVRVTENEIRSARKFLLEDEGIEAEFSAAAAVASIEVMRRSGWLKGDEVTLVNVTGNNGAAVAEGDMAEFVGGVA